jgi:uncharacterized membrane protein YgcG
MDGDPTALAALDRALDELAAGRDAEAAGEAAALAALAAELQAAVPAPPPAVAEHGRAAFLARAEVARLSGRRGQGVKRRADRFGGTGRWRRSLSLRVVALAAALVLLVAVPAAVARQARPGTALWPLRQAGQQVRLALAGDPVHRAHLRLNTAQSFLAAGAGAGQERRKDLADQAEDQVKAALEVLDDLAGPRAAAERARAERLLADLEALEDQDDPDDRSGPGSGSGAGEDRSGRGGGGSDDRSGGGGSDRDGPRSGSGSPGSGSGRSGSGGSGGD